MHFKIRECGFFKVEKVQTKVTFFFKSSDLIELFFGSKEKGNAVAFKPGEGRFLFWKLCQARLAPGGPKVQDGIGFLFGC